eukprot:jgi/Botrbrau1/13388/Bobra.0194s0019.1
MIISTGPRGIMQMTTASGLSRARGFIRSRIPRPDPTAGGTGPPAAPACAALRMLSCRYSRCLYRVLDNVSKPL